MDVGRAITEAMQLDKCRDEWRMMCRCPYCRKRRADEAVIRHSRQALAFFRRFDP